MAKRLVAFDFDYTIIQENSDAVLCALLPKQSIPATKGNSWTVYMQQVFDLLYENNIPESHINTTIKQLEAITGMKELIRELSDNLNFDIIIISDANSYIIETWLEEHKLSKNIVNVFSNPAQFVNGKLNIKFYHPFQNSCNLSEPSLCKGDVLQQFVESQSQRGVAYSQVVYVGDGVNDLCPMLRLTSDDVACYRKNFSCDKAICNIKNGKPVRNKVYNIKANLVCWSTGFEILSHLKQLLVQ